MRYAGSIESAARSGRTAGRRGRGVLLTAAVSTAVVGSGLLAGAGPASAVTAAGVIPAAAGATPAAAVTPPWRAAIQVPGLSSLPHYGGSVGVAAVSCPSAGNCVAIGNYQDGTGVANAFTAAEVNGSWRNAAELPFPAADDAALVQVNALSCASAGNCGAGGYYVDSSGDTQAFTAEEVHGTWQDAVEVLSTEFLADENAQVLSIACPSAGNCTIGGAYHDSAGHQQAFVGDERNGSWEAAQEVPGTAALNGKGNAQVLSVSCASPGNCGAGGYFVSAAGNRQAFVVTEEGHSWGSARQVAGALNTNGFAEIDSMSCPSSGNCGAGGVYTAKAGGGTGEGFVVSEANGSWQPAREVAGKLNLGGDGEVSSVSCRSAGNCTAAGFYLSAAKKGKYEGFVIGDVKGAWGGALEVPGLGALNAGGGVSGIEVSCASAGNCAAAGNYLDESRRTQAFASGETGGRWALAAAIPGSIALNKGGNASAQSVSCAPAVVVSCAAGGYYAATPSFGLGFVVSGGLPQTSRPVLALSLGTITYGHEQRERITVTVAAQRAGKPTGTVTVRAGDAILCAFSLSSGKGACALSARRLSVGKHSLTASYGGSVAFASSVSAARVVTVLR